MNAHSAEKDAPCRCEWAHLGAQAAGTPIRCERCRGLVDAVAAQRMEALYAESRRRLEANCVMHNAGTDATPPQDAILLDAFCCQGGASMGYHRAGFKVFGIDIDPQPHYPFPFHQGDAIEALDSLASGRGVLFTRPDRSTVELFEEQIAAKHASPPCQAFTLCQRIQGNEHPDLIAPTRELFEYGGTPYVIENVEGAPLIDPVLLCGAMFGLETYRHRLFESNVQIAAPEHPGHVARTTKMGRAPVDGEFMHIVGNFSGVDRGREVMDMQWATRDGLREAIPPAYTEHVGQQLLAALAVEAAA